MLDINSQFWIFFSLLRVYILQLTILITILVFFVLWETQLGGKDYYKITIFLQLYIIQFWAYVLPYEFV